MSIVFSQTKNSTIVGSYGSTVYLSDAFDVSSVLSTPNFNLESIQIYTKGSQPYIGSIEMVFVDASGTEYKSTNQLTVPTGNQQQGLLFTFEPSVIQLDSFGLYEFFLVKAGTSESVSLNLVAGGSNKTNNQSYNPLQTSTIQSSISIPGYDLKMDITVAEVVIPECGLSILAWVGFLGAVFCSKLFTNKRLR